MAKISARGSTEIARIKARSEASGETYIYIMTSDGRILMRNSKDSGYTIARRIKAKDNITREQLERFIKLRGLSID